MAKGTFFENLCISYPNHITEEINFLWEYCAGQVCWEYNPCWDPNSSADWDWIYDMLNKMIDKEIRFLEKE